MSGIVERLRDAAALPNGLYAEAADTITDLLAELRAAKGYMLNARFDLETGTKAAGIATIEGGIKRIDAAIAKVRGGAS